jgi:hypothetical protein
MARSEPRLLQEAVVEFNGTEDTGVGKWVNRVQQRVRVDVIIGRKLRFNARDRNEAADADVQSLSYLRDV